MMQQKRRSTIRNKPLKQTKASNASLRRCRLSQRFHQNWMARNGIDNNQAPLLDDSLTSLSWLQNLNIRLPTEPGAGGRVAIGQTHNSSVNPNSILDCSTSPNREVPTNVDYFTVPVKPPHSYATLICMAMKASKRKKMTLSAIYQWISEHFAYYRTSDISWQNSIRHNLSLNKYFQKVPRLKEEPGKGCFWQINPEFASRLEKRGIPAAPMKPIKCEPGLQRVGIDSNFNVMTKPVMPGMRVVASGSELESSFIQQNGALKGDFSFNSLLTQDIEVDGVKIKTEDLITDQEPTNTVRPISPQLDLNDVFPGELNSIIDQAPVDAVDQVTNDPLDLSISGIGIKAPDWWESDVGLLRSPRHSPAPGMPTPDDVAQNENFLHQLVRDVDFDVLLDMTE